jgi:sugar phosphate isomerase/epimerase
MNRRTFVQQATLALTAGRSALLARARPAAAAIKPLGLELYTVRKELSADPAKTLAAVAAIGYSYVEVVWPLLKMPVPDFRKLLDAAGLRARSGHIGTAVLDAGWEAQLDSAKAMGHEYLIVASLPGGQRRTLDDWRRWADRFNQAAVVARKHDLGLGFHTEPDNFPAVEGKVPYDVFVERLDPKLVRLQFDIGNAAMAGADPLEYVTRWRDRYDSFHIKDVPTLGKIADTELGAGVLDLKKILKAAGDLSGKLLYVEQEGSADSIASAKKDFDYLAGMEM